MSKNEQTRFFVSQLYFPVILPPWIWKVSVTIVGYTGLGKKFKKYSGEIKSLGVHGNMGGCILEFNSEGLGW